MEPAAAKAAEPSQAAAPKRSHWLWIPSLYFAQGIPYVAVNTMSVVMYKRLGVSNTEIALYTSLLNLPWVLKPLWSPFVDIYKTKRLWIVVMQLLMAVGLIAAGASVQTAAFFFFSLSIFWAMAFASATHDIAADGFYMLSLSKHDQTWWNGIRSTFYRVAMIVGSGLLIVLAGILESKNGLAPVEIPINATQSAEPLTNLDPASIQASGLGGELRLVTQPANLTIPITERTADEAKAITDRAKAWNREHGFIAVEKPVEKKSDEISWWTENISKPLGDVLKKRFPKEVKAKPSVAGNVGAIYFNLSKEPPGGKEIVVYFERKKSGREYFGFSAGDRGFKLVEGERFVFTSANWNKPAMAVVQLDPKLKQSSSVVFNSRAGNIPLAWSITLFLLGGMFLVGCLYHHFFLPRPASDVPVTSGGNVFAAFFGTFGSYFRKPGIVVALLFIFFYRFAEAQALKLIHPFMLDPREIGGLALSTSQVGLAYGTFGILALTFGGILGAILAAKYGLKKMLPIMVCVIHLPNFAFLYLAMAQPENFALISGCIAIEQFGYGFGFAAYMLFLLYFADGEHKTAHYAICTGFMALGIMLPGMWSGWLQDLIGYKNFFFWIMLSTIPGFLVAFLVKVDPQFGKKTS
jgi:MFS transporter, PAT family, beta-lactamase induction signal transducer AmpG